MFPAGPLPTPDDLRETGEGVAEAIVEDPEIAESRAQAREDGVGPLDTINVGLTTLAQPIQDRLRPDDPEATQAVVEPVVDESTDISDPPGGATDVIDTEQGRRGDEIAADIQEKAQLWLIDEPLAGASQALLGYRAVDPNNRGAEPLQGFEGLEVASIVGGQAVGGTAAKAAGKVGGKAAGRAASGATTMSAAGLTKLGRGIARRIPGGSLPTGGFGDAAEQTARRGDGDTLGDAAERLDAGDGDLIGTRVTRNDAGVTVGDEFAASTETAFEESVGDVVAAFPAGRRGGAGLDFGEAARQTGDEFGPLRAGTGPSSSGASDETLREAVGEIETTIRRGGDEPGESATSTATRTGDDGPGGTGGGGGDGGGGGGGGGGPFDGGGDGPDQELFDGDRSLLGRIREFFLGTRRRTAATTAAATTGAVGATYGGAQLVGGDGGSSGPGPGGGPTGGGTGPVVDARIEAPRSVPQGERLTATGRLQNSGSEPYAATLGLFIVINDQPGRIGQSSVSVSPGASRTIEFTLSGNETAQAPAGEWPLVLAPVRGGRLGEPLARTTVGIEPTRQGNTDDGGGPPNPVEDGEGRWRDARLVRQLEGGWYLARQDAVQGDNARFAVLGKDSQGVIYLQSDGTATRSQTTFDTRQKALQAHQRWVQRAQQGDTQGPTPNESDSPPDPSDMDDGGLLTRRNLLLGGVAVAGLWYVSGGAPLSWVKGKVSGAVDTISNIGGS